LSPIPHPWDYLFPDPYRRAQIGCGIDIPSRYEILSYRLAHGMNAKN
jgi:hypothetical protein